MPLVNAVLIKPDCYDPKQMPWRCHSCRFDTLTCQGGRALTNLIFMRGKNRVAPLERWKLRLAYQCEIINLNFAFAFAERKVNSGERENERREWDGQTAREWESGRLGERQEQFNLLHLGNLFIFGSMSRAVERTATNKAKREKEKEREMRNQN